MFGSELQAISRKAGFRPVTLRPGSELSAGDILVVDLAARLDWESPSRSLLLATCPSWLLVRTLTRKRAGKRKTPVRDVSFPTAILPAIYHIYLRSYRCPKLKAWS